jgi:CRISPR-associated protein Cmr2
LAISGALNDFSLNVARHVVEHEHLGRLLYAGGDDVMAMLPTSDLLSCMVRLNCAYQGHDPTSPSDWGKAKAAKDKILLKNGFGILNNKLMRLMGEKATASIGAVIAHHQAPLSAVLRELRAAEKRAKRDVKDGGGGRNAFSISIVKRSGGTLVFTAQWGDTMQLFEQLLHYLRDEGVSRRVVYHILEWLKDLEAQPNPEMLQSLLAYQLDRQADKAAKEHHNLLNLAENLAKHTKDQGDKGKAWLENLLGVAEFLARETRTGASA